MQQSVKPSNKQKQEAKEKIEMIVEKMEGGILVRRYKGKKVELEPDKSHA